MCQGNEAKKGNYGRELLRYYQLVDSDAADRELQTAVLANALVNPTTADSLISLELMLKRARVQFEPAH
jgi:hypothetical protein